MHKRINVSSEIEPLRRVLVHRPDAGIARVSPKRAEELLFDDIVFLPNMQKEHDNFKRIVEAFVGKQGVLETEDLLVEALTDDQTFKQEFLEKVIRFEELPSSAYQLLADLSSKALARVLITGYYEAEDYYLFDPIPNFIFTRDIAVTVNDHIIITRAAKIARQRENLLTRYIIAAHRDFAALYKEGRVLNLNRIDEFPPSRQGERVSIEGGDMMIINRDYLLIGTSERTSSHAVDSIAKVLFEKNVVSNIVQVNIPSDRSFMHIDTLFTQIDKDDIVCYKPIVFDGNGSNVIVHRKNGASVTYSSIKDFFHGEINAKMRFIFAGNGISPFQEREQWTDGCNLVALRPGVGITYDRNPKTEVAFKAAGYDVITSTDFFKISKKKGFDPEKMTKTIITFPSGELSRARGGSHCMTCPVLRAE